MVLKNCSCSHEFQDKRYGKGRRMCTEGTNKKTCTVCGSTDTATKRK